MRIQSSENFLKDLKRYNNALENIESAEVKNKLKSLINSLIVEVKKIDYQHQDNVVNNSSLLTINESRSNIKNIRNDIEKIIRSSS